jgi:hypothetical protein
MPGRQHSDYGSEEDDRGLDEVKLKPAVEIVRLHAEVWTTDASFADSLRNTLSEEEDPAELVSSEKGIADDAGRSCPEL